MCVEEDLDVDEIKKLAEWHGFDGVATEMAVRAEAKSLSDFGVYEEVQSSDVPSGTRIIGSKIVLRERHGKVKARLCAQDFAHHQKRDELYSPTPSVTALRLVVVFGFKPWSSIENWRFFDSIPSCSHGH